MRTTATRVRTAPAVLLALVGLLASLLLAVATPGDAEAAPAEVTVVGQVRGPQDRLPKILVRWFTKDWTYLGQRQVRNGIYVLKLPPGTYHLQFVDQRPSYQLDKYAPADVTVTLRDRKVQKDVRMRRGGAITGTVKAGGKPARGARVVAANTYEQSYETKANGRGEFAIGGLPTSRYSVFTYDRAGAWVDRSTFAGKVVRGRVRDVRISLGTRAGSLLVDLVDRDGRAMPGTFAVTAVSRKSGQWWTARARHGRVTFRGLFPGRYTLVAPGAGDYLPRTGPIQGANVRPGRADLASRFVWTKRGASVVGHLVDENDGSTPMRGVQVQLFDRAGRLLGTTRSTSSGEFRFGGRLTTQTGLTVAATGGWMQAAQWCEYARTSRSGIAVTTGRETYLGSIVMRLVPTESVQCQPG